MNDTLTNTVSTDLFKQHQERIHKNNLVSEKENQALKDSIKELLKKNNATLIAHYYVDHQIQALAEEVNGCVSDSLEMAKFGKLSKSNLLVVAGVKFMGETAKILSPEKKVIMPTLEATCSLDIGCPAEDFKNFCSQYPDREIVVYANTSAKVKALADWVVTSSIAVEVIEYLDSLDKKIIWGPDKHLGSYLQTQTDADMVLWDGSCIVHDEFKFDGLQKMKKLHPDAEVLVHPESPKEVVGLADMVGSTSQILNSAKNSKSKKFIVATDKGIFYQLLKNNPNKEFYEAPTAGNGATCKSCSQCPWMGLNSLKNLEEVLKNLDNEIYVDPQVSLQANKSLSRMINFKS
ncbi:MAG: quinolinate synthase NadA [Gammaproteobacteria bacterium]|jgi:quinolinate synthase|tara:strand:- start:1394 stop:2437 length:1044 start_codon:yes stop_codon:yes gene_type:complete